MRHPFVDNIVGLLQRVLAGRAAQECLDGMRLAPAGKDEQLFVLPTWGWAIAAIDVGRKDSIAGSDERLLLPVRLVWEPGPVVRTVGTRRRKVSFSASGLGHTGAGEAMIDPVAGPGALVDGSLEPSETWGPIARGSRNVLAELQRLVADGHGAYWQVLSLLEQKAERALNFATSAAARDMHPAFDRSQALDATTLETLRSVMVYGEHGQNTPSPVQRLVERCTAPTTFAQVDPERYILTSLRRDAREEVRKALGDPRIGNKIRTLAAELGPVGLDELIAAYRRHYPADRLSTSRAMAALVLRPHPNASTFNLSDDGPYERAAS